MNPIPVIFPRGDLMSQNHSRSAMFKVNILYNPQLYFNSLSYISSEERRFDQQNLTTALSEDERVEE